MYEATVTSARETGANNMSNRIKVGISEYKISSAPDILMTLGLGSCVGIAIYDKISKMGGLSHIMLPDSTVFRSDIKPEKFADLAIPRMVNEITMGKTHFELIAKIAGGASMFSFLDLNMHNDIGTRNVIAAKAILNKLGIPIIASHTGGNIGRTMIVDLNTFEVNIKTATNDIITI